MFSLMNRIFFTLALVGIGLLLFEIVKGGRVAAERDRLAGKYGRIDVIDPGKMYIRRIPSDAPMDFAWRVYMPEGLIFEEYTNFFRYGGRHMSATDKGQGYCVLRTRLMPVKTGIRLDRIRLASTSSGMKFRADFRDFLEEHWGEFEVFVLGEDDQVEIDPNKEVATLVTVSIPSHLQAEAETLIGETQYANESAAQFLRIELGRDTLFKKDE